MPHYVHSTSKRRYFPGGQIHRVKKAWGEEQWIVNKEYCGKKLVLKKNHRCSMHEHKKKDEVFYLQSGKVQLELDGEMFTLSPGDFIHIPAGLPHRFTGLEDSEIMEFSTMHDEEDSYRSEFSGHVEQDRYDRQSALIEKFKGLPVLVVGDVMLDTYLVGSIDRVSPEAPIPVVRYRSEHSVPGGAANAAMNAAKLGAKVSLVGVCGDDAPAKELEKLLAAGGVKPVLIQDRKRRTTLKNRILAESGQQVVRLDYEEDESVPPTLGKKLLAQVEKLLPKCKALLLSDYAKGVFTPEVLAACIKLAAKAKVSVVLDPKPLDSSYLEAARGATVVTPNRREAQILASSASKSPEDLGHMLAKKIRGSVLLTLGAHGMLLIARDGSTQSFPALTREVSDVSGAGDTVTAVLTLVLAAGGSLADGADLSNRAASVVVTKQGTATLTPEEFLRVL
ncbi:MAG: D-beta-D-heptose 7-phosphate kinase / D-beta-D-heptose 1-phosphate adenosyltransferase [Candidatus Peregrinibacteria bacterium Greene0416_19]|nr:MAG: D-beta-D-heptose 7-phosphate kinase / D-beta-D-heptose 1-phosphate adenosyltransferase [Candidatus Peregrinibacteria bacterium Greene0416_19]